MLVYRLSGKLGRHLNMLVHRLGGKLGRHLNMLVHRLSGKVSSKYDVFEGTVSIPSDISKDG